MGTGAWAAPSREENGLSMSPFEGWKKKNSGAGGSSGTVGSPACLAAILAAALAAIFSLPAAILSWRVSVLSSRCVPCGCAWVVKRGEIGGVRQALRAPPQPPSGTHAAAVLLSGARGSPEQAAALLKEASRMGGGAQGHFDRAAAPSTPLAASQGQPYRPSHVARWTRPASPRDVLPAPQRSVAAAAAAAAAASAASAAWVGALLTSAALLTAAAAPAP